MPPTYCNSKQIGGVIIAKLIVTEKPSVAMAYAKVLGATNRQDGYLEGNGYLVSWCVGHLVELAPPNVYDAKYVKWSIADLPILPQKWQYWYEIGLFLGSFWYSDFEKCAILYHKQNIFRDFQSYCKTLSDALPVCGSSPLRFLAPLLDRKDRFG